MADPRYPPSGGSVSDLVARSQASAESLDNLLRKNEELQRVEERGDPVEQVSERPRATLAGGTRELSDALTQNIAAVNRETEAVLRNTEALAAKLAMVNRLREAEVQLAGAASQSVGASRTATSRAAAAPLAVPAAVIESDPRVQAAFAAQAAAERRVAESANAYRSSTRPTSGATTEESALLLQQNEAAKQQLAVTRQETAAAQRAASLEAQQAQAQAEALQIAQERNA